MQKVNFCTATVRKKEFWLAKDLLNTSDEFGGEIADLRNVPNTFSSSEGPEQQLLIDFNGNFFVVDPDQELVVSKRIVERLDSDASGLHSYTGGYELILRDRDSGDLSAVEFNRDGIQRTDALALDAFDIQEREIALQRDLDNNGIVGLQLQSKLFPSNDQSDSASYATGNDLCVYLAVDGSVILSRVELNIPDQFASGVTDAYGDGAPVYDLRSNNINL